MSDEEHGEGGARYCSQPKVPARVFDRSVSPHRAELIARNMKKWVNGTTLHYYFFDQDSDGEHVQLSDGSWRWVPWAASEDEKDVVRQGFAAWAGVGIGLEFKEVDRREEAEVRIGFMQGDGAWSYVGRDVIDVAPGIHERTMNFGWSLLWGDGLDTAIHEIGHTLGFPHEHQNPNAGIVWNEEAVYEALAAPPNNWSRDKTHYNIIRKLDPAEVGGSSWDPDSIMHYPFEAGLIKAPERYQDGLEPAPGLSEVDIAEVRRIYPPQEEELEELKPFQSQVLDIRPGEQVDFVVLPDSTREYNFRTFGVSDTVMVLFEEYDGELRYYHGDDDSGTDLNASFKARLRSGRRYVLRLRLYYADVSGQAALMMW